MPGSSESRAGAVATKQEVVKSMQATAFAKDWDHFKSHFTDQVKYRVGNVAMVTGPEAVASYLRDLPSTTFQIQQMEPRGVWETETAVVAEYTMQGLRLVDNKAVEYPCVDLYRFEGDKVCDWRVYAIEPTFIQDPGVIDARLPGAGPRQAEGAKSGLMAIVNSFQAALRSGNIALASSFLADDAVVRVGDRPEVRGPRAILGEIGEIFSERVRPTGADFVDSWEFDGVLLVELNVRATLAQDGRTVEYPCVESNRVEGGKIHEWRIYPIEAALLAGAGKSSR